MTRSVLVAYATRNGSTQEVAEAIADALRAEGHDVDTFAAGDVRDVSGRDSVVLGGAIYAGRLHRDARRFLDRHRRALAALPVAVFAMGPRTLAPDALAESRAQLDEALARVPEVHPVAVTIFGGVLDPAKLHFPFNRMPACDARDWDAIAAWARELAARLATPRAA